MATSLYANWSDSFLHPEPLKPELDGFQSELPPELLLSALSYDYDNTVFPNLFWEPDQFFYNESYIDPDSVYVHNRDSLLSHQHGQMNQIRAVDYTNRTFYPGSLGFDQVQVHAMEQPRGAVPGVGNWRVGVEKEQGKQSGRVESLSPQSLAARERRRRITEKTRQLAKLIPGAHKLNTADMFQAGLKYVKFLQAQLAVLQFAESTHQEEKKEFGAEEVQFVLLDSPSVQEKLYMEEKCFIASDLLQKIASANSGDGVELDASSLKGINSLIKQENLDHQT